MADQNSAPLSPQDHLYHKLEGLVGEKQQVKQQVEDLKAQIQQLSATLGESENRKPSR